MSYKNMEEVKKDSVRIEEGMISVYPQFGRESRITVMETLSKFNGDSVYCTNNSTIAYILEDGYYAIPYTRSAISIISEHCRKDCFAVPFSNGDYPKDEKNRWMQLRAMARETYKEDFKEDCKDWCDKHHIGELPSEVLEQCFKIPEDGVSISHLGYENCVYPVLRGTFLDCVVIERLGRFCTNNGKVVFVYRDGSSYVCKGYGIIAMLREAGYKESGIFVPFSNGEIITNSSLRKTWENLKKF